MTRRDGSVLEAVQPDLRGGRHEPLSREELEAKFLANAAHGGLGAADTHSMLEACQGLFAAHDLTGLAKLRPG